MKHKIMLGILIFGVFYLGIACYLSYNIDGVLMFVAGICIGMGLLAGILPIADPKYRR